MDRMHTIRIHIIWKAAAAANSTDDHNILTRYAHVWHYLLNLGQNRIISATRAPAHFLVSCKIFRCKGWASVCYSTHGMYITAKIFCFKEKMFKSAIDKSMINQ